MRKKDLRAKLNRPGAATLNLPPKHNSNVLNKRHLAYQRNRNAISLYNLQDHSQKQIAFESP